MAIIPSKYGKERPMFGALKGPLETYTLNTTAGAGSTNSTTPVDYPGPLDKAFIKRDTSTSMLATGFAGAFKTVNVGFMEFWLRINSVDYFLTSFFYNDLSTHRMISFNIPVAGGIPAGPYTARLRWSTNTATINADGNDRFQIALEEGYFA